MHISSFQIENFGIFSEVAVENISPRLSIFFGPNEAGKTTCMEFLRFMLTGQWERRKHPGKNDSTARAAGSMVLDDNGNAIAISRNSMGQCAIFDQAGFPLPPDSLDLLLNGLDYNIYKNIFGFSLEELEKLSSIDSAEIRNMFYGASIGIGLRPLSSAFKTISSKMKAIYQDGGDSPLNKYMAELEAARKEIVGMLENRKQYEVLQEKISEMGANLAAMQERKNNLELKKGILERRLTIWSQWEELKSLKLQMEAMPLPPENLSGELVERILKIEESLNKHKDQRASILQNLEILEGKKAEIKPDSSLSGELALIRGLSERKSSYLKAVQEHASFKDEARGIDAELERNLALLGPEWSCERIRATDRTFMNRDDLANAAKELTSANQGLQANQDNLSIMNQNIGELGQAIEKAASEIEMLPGEDAELDEAARDLLRQNLHHLEECRRNEPGRKKAVETAKAVFTSALTQANLAWHKDEDLENETEGLAKIKKRIDLILASQVEAVRIAEEVKTLQQEAADCARAFAQDEENLLLAQKRLANAEDLARSQVAPGREELERRARDLKSLRSMAASIETEQERMTELDQRLAQMNLRQPNRPFILLMLSGILLFAGIGIIGASKIWGITEINFGSGLNVPLNLWAAYFSILCGVIILGASLPGNRADRKKLKLELAEIEHRRKASANRLKDLAERAQELCGACGVKTMDEITLDAKEALLEREKEQCIHEERSLVELEGLHEDVEKAQEKMEILAMEVEAKKQNLQQSRMRWHALLQNLGASIVPLPEGAETFFARLESARMASENLKNAQEELNALWEDLHLAEEAITSTPAIQKRLEENQGEIGMMEAANMVLDACKHADAIRFKKEHLEENLAELKERHAQFASRQREALASLTESEERVNAARKDWAKKTAGIGFGATAEPETVTEAFGTMEKCLGLADKLDSVNRKIARTEVELSSMEEPLQNLLSRLGRESALLNGGTPDWIETLDTLKSDLDNTLAMERELKEIEEKVSEAKSALEAENAAIKNAKTRLVERLGSAGAENVEELLKFADTHEKRQHLKEEIARLESVLQVKAGDVPLEKFLQGFDNNEESEQKSLAEMQAELAGLTETTAEMASELAKLKAEAKELEVNDNLAASRQKEAFLEEAIEKASTKWSSLALAEALIKRAKGIYEREKQPEILKEASKIFTKITKAGWTGINASLEAGALAMTQINGSSIAPDQLSRGAREQAYLAIRLGCIRNYAAKWKAVPVMMDEILVNFDPERTEMTIEAISELAHESDNGQQIFYFTCQPAMLDLFRKFDPSVPVYLVKDRNIKLLEQG